MSWVASTNKFSMAVGVAGAYVEVTPYVIFSEGSITRSVGRQSAFSDVGPGQFAFTLDNRDGIWTPDNASSTLATKLSEGVGVCWQLDSRLVSGRVRSLTPIFSEPGSPEIFRMRVVCDDMLGSAGRSSIDELLAKSIVLASSPYFYYPLNEIAGSLQAADASGNRGPTLSGNGTTALTFGSAGITAVGETQAVAPASAGTTLQTSTSAPYMPITPSGTFPVLSCWVTEPIADTWFITALSDVCSLSFGRAPSGNAIAQVAFTSPSVIINAAMGTYPALSSPSFVAVTVSYVGTNFTVNAYVNGVVVATNTLAYTGALPTQWKVLGMGNTAAGSTLSNTLTPLYFSHLALTKNLAHEEYVALTTEASRLQAVDATTPEVVLGTLPSDLSTSPLGPPVTGVSALDMLNDVIRTEQGQIYTATSGTLLAPVQTVQVRARNRPTAVTASFSVSGDIHSSPDFKRDLNDSVSSVTATGTGNTATATDASLIPKVGSANASIKVLYAYPSDTFTAASDRINRGKKRLVDIQSIRIDLRSGIDRSADILNLVPGNRYQITALPVAQLGYSTWDGWYIGHNETHTIDSSFFDLYFEPCTAAEAIFDTDRFMGGTALTLSASITAVATSMSVATSDPLVKLAVTGAGTPYNLIIDNEIVTVTACTGTTPQAVSITRAQAGTSAAAHAVGTVTDVAPSALFAY